MLLHAAVYCGMPAGMEAFRAAEDVIESWQAEGLAPDEVESVRSAPLTKLVEDELGGRIVQMKRED